MGNLQGSTLKYLCSFAFPNAKAWGVEFRTPCTRENSVQRAVQLKNNMPE